MGRLPRLKPKDICNVLPVCTLHLYWKAKDGLASSLDLVCRRIKLCSRQVHDEWSVLFGWHSCLLHIESSCGADGRWQRLLFEEVEQPALVRVCGMTVLWRLFGLRAFGDVWAIILSGF